MFYVRWAVHPKAQSGMEGNNLLRIQRTRQVGIWQVVTAMKADIQISVFEAHLEPETCYGITTFISRVTLE
jgi:hypothetical protein